MLEHLPGTDRTRSRIESIPLLESTRLETQIFLERISRAIRSCDAPSVRLARAERAKARASSV